MQTLFTDETNQLSGFSYRPDFITRDEETELRYQVLQLSLQPLKFQGFVARRLVRSFGLHYHFDQRKVTPGEPIPEGFSFLVKKVAAHLSMLPEEFAELLVTEYPPGSVINWHRDGPPFKLIAGISLLSDCIFKFRPHDRLKQNRKATVSYPVERRSLYVIEGIAREEWEHSIAPVRQTRFSITLRTLK